MPGTQEVPMLETTVTGDQRAGSDGHMVKDVMLMFNCQVVSNSFVSPGTVVCQASLSVGFPRQEYWSELPSFVSKVMSLPFLKYAL